MLNEKESTKILNAETVKFSKEEPPLTAVCCNLTWGNFGCLTASQQCRHFI
jgi:hypothetical protein